MLCGNIELLFLILTISDYYPPGFGEKYKMSVRCSEKATLLREGVWAKVVLCFLQKLLKSFQLQRQAFMHVVHVSASQWYDKSCDVWVKCLSYT